MTHTVGGVEYPQFKPCPACGQDAEYPYSPTFVGAFRCPHCGAFHPGDCGVVRPGYFTTCENSVIHHMTSQQAAAYRAMIGRTVVYEFMPDGYIPVIESIVEQQ